MSTQAEIVTVDGSNVDELGFFCYKSKPQTPGYRSKLEWLHARMAEGLRLKMVYEGKRSVGFVEYLPGEAAWRAVHAAGYLFIQCLWVVGRAKGHGYGLRLLEACVAEARQAGAHGVATVTTNRVWLADKPLFLKAGFEVVDQAPPAFELVVKRFDDAAPLPAFPQDWQERAQRYGDGLTVIRSDQCPYIQDATQQVVDLAHECRVEARVVHMGSAQDVQSQSPSPYGVFGVVYDGKLLSYHYLGSHSKLALVGLLTGNGKK